MTEPTIITAQTTAGAKLYAAVRPSETGARGVVTQSAFGASLAPFSSLEAAINAIKRIGGIIDPPWKGEV